MLSDVGHVFHHANVYRGGRVVESVTVLHEAIQEALAAA